jgi:hypothetical protein
MLMQNTTFFIYTTGLAYCISDHDMLLYWEEILLKILHLVPLRFTRIEIYNSDILYDITDIHARQRIIQDMNIKMSHFINDRIKVNIFIDTEFDCFINDCYLLIDCAHIYNYVKKGYVKRNKHYGEKIDTNELQISSIYLGYFGHGEKYYDNFTNYYIINSNFLKILDDNTVSTYIDRLIELNYNDNQELFDPCDTIKEIFNKIRLKYMNLWRSIYSRVDDSFDIEFNNYRQLIVSLTIDIIMDETYHFTKNELIDYVYTLVFS